MHPEILVQLLPALLTAMLGGGGIAALSSLTATWLRERSKAKIDEAQQPINQYSELIGHLTQRITVVENAHKECQEHHTRCESQLGELRGRVDELSRMVQLPQTPIQMLVQGTDKVEVESNPPSQE